MQANGIACATHRPRFLQNSRRTERTTEEKVLEKTTKMRKCNFFCASVHWPSDSIYIAIFLISLGLGRPQNSRCSHSSHFHFVIIFFLLFLTCFSRDERFKTSEQKEKKICISFAAAKGRNFHHYASGGWFFSLRSSSTSSLFLAATSVFVHFLSSSQMRLTVYLPSFRTFRSAHSGIFAATVQRR